MNNFYINKRVNPKGLKKDEYDVIIIGAGIGGLVCGCYLAKAGMKVLIVEKNNKPGGYVQSFTANGFTFDIGVHALEGVNNEKTLGKVIRDLELTRYVTFYRRKITDTFIFRNNKVNFFSDEKRTLHELKSIFHRDYKNINAFLGILKGSLNELLYKFRNETFENIINNFFKEEELKDIFFALMRNTGTPSSIASAIPALIFLKTYLFEGGYYPIGGMQKFSNALLAVYKNLGGSILFNMIAKRIYLDENNKASGIRINKKIKIPATKVICAGDLSYTINKLLPLSTISTRVFRRLGRMRPTLSSFIVYLGLNKSLREAFGGDVAVWIIDKGKERIDKEFEKVFAGKLLLDNKVRMIGFCPLNNRNKESLYIVTASSFKNSEILYKKDENIITGSILKSIEEKLRINISPFIELSKIATPYTFYEYTLNKEGALHGWAPTSKQIWSNLIIKELRKISNIYFVGHWVTGFGQGGIPWVIKTAFDTLKKILENKWQEER